MTTPNTLGLDDDLDSVEVLDEVAAAFGVRLSDAEAAGCRTVGDLHHHLRVRLAAGDPAECHDVWRGCATAAAFRRLRHAAAELGLKPPWRPDTPLDGIPARALGPLFRDLAARTGLALPARVGTWPSVAGAVLIPGALLSILVPGMLGAGWWGLPPALLGAGYLLVRRDPGGLPVGCRTAGDLARMVAARNLAALLPTGAAPRERDVWRALVELLAARTELPRGQIGPDTVLLESGAQRA